MNYAFIGKNNAGKTTITTKLLTGLYTEYDGAIQIKGGWFITKGTPKPPDCKIKNGRKPTKYEQEKEHE